MSDGSVQQSTLLQVAGDGNGIPIYAQKLTAHREVISLKQTQEDADCKCTLLVLGLLAIISASASFALFYYSNNLTNYQISALAIGFTGVSAGFVIWICVRIKQSMTRTNQIKKVDFSGTNPIPWEEILQHMEHEDVTQGHIQATLEGMRGRRGQFVQYTHDQYFGEGKLPLSIQQKKVLQSFANLSVKLKSETVDPFFALEMLNGTNPSPSDNPSDEERIQQGTIKELIIRANGANVREKAAIFARHPLLMAQLAQSQPDSFPPSFIGEILLHMGDEQKVLFLKQIGRDAPSTPARQETILGIIKEAIPKILTPIFATQFSIQERGEEDQPQLIPPVAQALLTEVARWPAIASAHIHLDSNLVTQYSFIQALVQLLDEGQISTYIQAVVEAMHLEKNTEKATQAIVATIRHFHQDLPDLFVDIYKHLPLPLFAAKEKLKSGEEVYLAKIISKMKDEDKKIFEETEKGSSFFGNLFGTNKAAGTVEQVKFKDLFNMDKGAAAVYLNNHPTQFNELVMDNQYLHSTEHIRHTVISILLLQNMECKAVEEVIDHLDRNVIYTNYNVLMNKLREMIRDIEDIATHPELIQLIALFRYAPDRAIAGMIRSKFELSTPWLSTARTKDEEWKRFIEIAEMKKESVWQSK